MGGYFPDRPPRRDLTAEEKTRIARRFRRRANLADAVCSLGFLCLGAGAVFRGWAEGLSVVCAVLMLAALLLCGTTFIRCPCCGRLACRGEDLSIFVWRGFECPACGFMPEWSR